MAEFDLMAQLGKLSRSWGSKLANWAHSLDEPSGKGFEPERGLTAADWSQAFEITMFTCILIAATLALRSGVIWGAKDWKAALSGAVQPTVSIILAGVFAAAIYSFCAAPFKIKVKISQCLYTFLVACSLWIALALAAWALLGGFKQYGMLLHVQRLVLLVFGVMIPLGRFYQGVVAKQGVVANEGESAENVGLRRRIAASVVGPVLIAMVAVIAVYGYLAPI